MVGWGDNEDGGRIMAEVGENSLEGCGVFKRRWTGGGEGCLGGRGVW